MAERKDDLKEGDSGFTNLCLNRQYSVMLTGITMEVMIVGTEIDVFDCMFLSCHVRVSE